MVSSVTSHEEKDCHLQYSRSHVASFSQAMNMKQRSLHLLRYLFSCSITLQGTSLFLMFNLPCSNPWPRPLAVMPVATTTLIWFCHLYGSSLSSCTRLLLGSTFTLSSGLTSALVPRTSLNLRDVSISFWCPHTLPCREKTLQQG